ncbi:MAG: hypothetical protein GX947_06010 [Tissierellia bacterium]|nr:hypothetical protein [Tissierellia bacterium]
MLGLIVGSTIIIIEGFKEVKATLLEKSGSENGSFKKNRKQRKSNVKR